VRKEVFKKFLTTEYAYITPKGEPLCWPVTPYWNESESRPAIATGLAYPNKADYAKSNPKVALLYSDPKGSGMTDPPRVLVQGDAIVFDQDLQENADRYVQEIRSRFPIARLALNNLTVKWLDFYIPRLWVEIVPRSIQELPPPMPPSSGSTPAPGESALSPADSLNLKRTVEDFDHAVLTTIDDDGYPSPRKVEVSWNEGSLSVGGSHADGPACITFHRHSLGAVRLEAHLVRGEIEEGRFKPRRLVGFFGNGFVFPLSVLPEAKRLRKRLKSELTRRGKVMPLLRIPDGR
jgi:hypothetical protein